MNANLKIIIYYIVGIPLSIILWIGIYCLFRMIRNRWYYGKFEIFNENEKQLIAHAGWFLGLVGLATYPLWGPPAMLIFFARRIFRWMRGAETLPIGTGYPLSSDQIWFVEPERTDLPIVRCWSHWCNSEVMRQFNLYQTADDYLLTMLSPLNQNETEVPDAAYYLDFDSKLGGDCNDIQMAYDRTVWHIGCFMADRTDEEGPQQPTMIIDTTPNAPGSTILCLSYLVHKDRITTETRWFNPETRRRL